MFRKPSLKASIKSQQQQQQHQQQQPTSMKRSSSILNRLIRRSSSSTQAVNTLKTPLPVVPMFEPSSPALSTNSQFSRSSSTTSSTSVENNHNEKLPLHWELRYDTLLCQFYYINTQDNTVQFDSPLEVLKR